ncbi:hypothetical protein QR98_0101680, partial [Sarcoptes scabiei]
VFCHHVGFTDVHACDPECEAVGGDTVLTAGVGEGHTSVPVGIARVRLTGRGVGVPVAVVDVLVAGAGDGVGVGVGGVAEQCADVPGVQSDLLGDGGVGPPELFEFCQCLSRG